jgi:integrin alpha FG-GAP repeat containing protein 1
MWTPIVPHTQLIIIPNSTDPTYWTISIYMEPTEKIKTVFQFTVLSLIIIGLMIYYFNSKEKAEDRENMTNFYTLLK